MTRWVGFISHTPFTTTRRTPNRSFWPVGWLSSSTPLNNNSSNHPTCHLDTLGGFLSPDPPLQWPAEHPTCHFDMLGAILNASPPTTTPAPPNMSEWHVGWLSSPTPLSNNTNNHPACHLDTLGGFRLPLSLDYDPPNTHPTDDISTARTCHSLSRGLFLKIFFKIHYTDSFFFFYRALQDTATTRAGGDVGITVRTTTGSAFTAGSQKGMERAVRHKRRPINPAMTSFLCGIRKFLWIPQRKDVITPSSWSTASVQPASERRVDVRVFSFG